LKKNLLYCVKCCFCVVAAIRLTPFGTICDKYVDKWANDPPPTAGLVNFSIKRTIRRKWEMLFDLFFVDFFDFLRVF
jgi:hypothetical protein